jgi:hypothetical protein
LSCAALLLAVDLAYSQTTDGRDPNAPSIATAPSDKDESRPDKQQQPEASQARGPSQLEQMLAEALANNPDIRVAEAKLREAQAELNRVRLQVLQRVSTLHHAVETQKAVVEAIRRSPDVGAHRLLPIEEAKSASLEAEIPVVLGRPPHGAAVEKMAVNFRALDVGPVGADMVVIARPAGNTEITWSAMADRIRKALDRPVQLDMKDKPLSEALKMIEENAPGIAFHTVLPTEQMARMKLTLHLKDVPLGAALQALEDSFPEMNSQDLGRGRLRLAVREYGILITTQGSLPPGAMPLHVFWTRHSATEKPSWSAPDNAVEPSRPPENLEGVIKRSDPQSGLVTISLGSDAGLRRGHTLEVYRVKPEPRYLGSIRIVDVHPTEAVAKPTSGPRVAIEVGDRVTSSIRRR